MINYVVYFILFIIGNIASTLILGLSIFVTSVIKYSSLPKDDSLSIIDCSSIAIQWQKKKSPFPIKNCIGIAKSSEFKLSKLFSLMIFLFFNKFKNVCLCS